VGIPPEHLPRLFERFYRVDGARSRVSGGTGLGLALVKHVAERSGGSVEITSEVGEGSTVTLRLPRAR
jgi:two-component system phosphate regulon sensor histidine kinase PhoR